MALYFISSGNPPETVFLVRAKNGHRALELAGMDGATVTRVTEAGDEGIVMPDGSTGGVAAKLERETDGAREVEVTDLSDRGVRRFRNLDSGAERTEPRVTGDT